MKRIFTAILFMASLCLNAATYYVAPNGSDTNPGTITAPWQTWQKAFSSLAPGDILYVRGGNYTGMYDSGHGVFISSRSGSSSAVITVMAYPGEVPVLDCSSLSASAGVNFGILMRSCNYWNLKGLTLKNVREYNNLSQSSGGSPVGGWELGDCSNITLEQCIVTACGNGFSVNGTVNNIKYKYCDSYGNYDYYDNGGLANGFNGNMRGGSTITYEGCRAWSNSDDGYDNYGGAGYITYRNCWAFGNGKGVPTSGNGDGFKLGYDNSSTELPNIQRTLYDCVSADNTLMGFDESMDGTTSMDMALYNCIAYKNTRDYGFRFYVTYGTGVTTLRNNIAYGNGINYSGRTRNITDHNTWDSGAPTVSDADFVSIDVSQMLRPRKSDGSLPDVDFVHLASGSDMIDAGTNVGLAFLGNAPDLGAFESGTVAPVQVVTYQSSSVKNTNASQVEIIYDHTLSTVAPSSSAYEVKVNSVVRSVSSLSISGQNVYLNLSSPVKYGDVISFSYIKPSTNPLTCTTGTQAESISGKSVTNLVQAPAATLNYLSSSVKNSLPSQVEVVYDLALSTVAPSASAYEIKVNSIVRSISSLSISGQNVYLNLSAPVVYGDAVSISYTKPSTNPLTATVGAQAESFTARTVTNLVLAPAPQFTGAVVNNDSPSKIQITFNENLANIIPSSSAFVTRVNGASASIQTVTILNNTVSLTLASALHFNDSITVSYTQPATNALQSINGGLAASFSNKPVTNNIIQTNTGSDVTANDSNIDITPNPSRGYIRVVNFVPGTQEAVLKLFDFSGKLCQEIRLVNYTPTTQYQILVNKGVYIAQLYSGTIVRHVQKLIVLK